MLESWDENYNTRSPFGDVTVVFDIQVPLVMREKSIWKKTYLVFDDRKNGMKVVNLNYEKTPFLTLSFCDDRFVSVFHIRFHIA